MSDTTARDADVRQGLREVRARTDELRAYTSALTSRTEAVKREAWEVRLRAKAARDWAAAVRMARHAPRAHVRDDAPVRSFTLEGELGGYPVRVRWDHGRLTGDPRLITHAQLLADLGTVFINVNPLARVEATLTGEPAAVMLTLARAWPEVLSNAVDPGWVPTKMGGAAATGDLEMGYLTQTWLAVSNDAAATVSGGYWHHRQRQPPAPQARDPAFQDQLMDRLAALTGVALFCVAVAGRV